MGYITPATVAEHNTHTDCWVSFLGKVFDLTKLVAENEGILTQPIVAAAGTDISQWFNPNTGDVRPSTL
jgi:cytochrome b involved in lipid metabolism